MQQFHNNLWILSLFYTVTKTEAVYKIIYNELMRQKRYCMLVSKCSSKGITHTVIHVRWTLDQWKIEYISFQAWRCVTLIKISINVFCIKCSQMSSKYILQLLAMNFECLLFLTLKCVVSKRKSRKVHIYLPGVTDLALMWNGENCTH